jgi:hypothetical protein
MRNDMLVREEGPDEAIIIGQASHAWVSGQIASRWAEPIPHREHLVLAATQHDIGMAEWDRAPTLDPETGWPTSFMKMPLETHLELWTEAPHKLVTQSRIAAIAVSLHGTKLYERRDLTRLAPDQAEAVKAYLAEQGALRERLAAVDAHETIQRLMFTWDWLSLGLCLKWAPADFGDELHLGHDTLTPWPFDSDEVTFVCEGRRLTRRAATEAELHRLIEEAERVELRFDLTRAPSGAP